MYKIKYLENSNYFKKWIGTEWQECEAEDE